MPNWLPLIDISQLQIKNCIKKVRYNEGCQQENHKTKHFYSNRWHTLSPNNFWLFSRQEYQNLYSLIGKNVFHLKEIAARINMENIKKEQKWRTEHAFYNMNRKETAADSKASITLTSSTICIYIVIVREQISFDCFERKFCSILDGIWHYSAITRLIDQKKTYTRMKV